MDSWEFTEDRFLRTFYQFKLIANLNSSQKQKIFNELKEWTFFGQRRHLIFFECCSYISEQKNASVLLISTYLFIFLLNVNINQKKLNRKDNYISCITHNDGPFWMTLQRSHIKNIVLMIRE